MAGFLERQTCTRCLGSGKHSFNQVDGDRCYGCGGTGRQLTKRGKAARAFLIEQQTRPIEDVRDGEFFWYDPYPLGGKVGWAVLRNIRADQLNPGRLHANVMRGERVSCTYGFVAGQRIRSVRDQAHLDQTIAAAKAYQDTLSESGKPLKRKAAAA